MKKVSTELFAFKLPESFDALTSSRIRIQADDTKTPRVAQGPLVSVTVFKTEDLDTEVYAGETLQEKFEDSCLSLSYKSEKLKGEKTKFKGFETYVLHAHTDASWQNIHFRIRYFYVGILLDKDYILEFRALHEKLPSKGLLDDWVMTVFKSLEILGDNELRHQTWKLHVLDTEEEEREYEERMKELRNTNEDKKRKEFLNVGIPQNGEEMFILGDLDFDFVAEETEMHIAEFSRELIVNIKAETSQIKKGVKAQLLDDYPNDGVVSIMIPAKGIHANGLPLGSLEFEEGKTNAPLFLHTRIAGFDYRLDLNCAVRFENGWFLLKGEMGKSYHDKKFPIQIAKKIDASALNWKEYRFTTMEETETANPEDIRFLALENPEFLKLPESIFSFKNLEDFSISQRRGSWGNQSLSLEKIQPEIEGLTQLQKFHLSGTSVKELPEGISRLKKLEHFFVNSSGLKHVPDGIWQLPRLKYLWLSSNALTRIPEEINLPELQIISLEKNAFKTLPEALAKQPKLKKINLEDNPLESLPAVFNEVEAVELSMENKLRLLDFDYKGADGKGLVSWDDAIFWSQNDADLISEIDEILKNNELVRHAAALRSLVKKSVGFRHVGEEDYTIVGNHRFGGMPDLPNEMEYPEFFGANDKQTCKYEFLGQINCGEIAHLQAYLPRRGMLYFFLESIHMVYGGTNSPCKVLFVEDTTNLASGRRFKFAADDYYEMYDGEYMPYKVDAHKINSAPSFYASYINTHLFIERKSLQSDKAFLEDVFQCYDEPIHAKNPFEYAVNAYGFSQHEHPELQASLKKKGNPEDWIILLTVTSSGDMQWGDAGDLFFVIHKSDLAKCDFSNVFVTMESS